MIVGCVDVFVISYQYSVDTKNTSDKGGVLEKSTLFTLRRVECRGL